MKLRNKSDPKRFPKETVRVNPCHVLSDRDENVPTFSSKFLLLPIFQSYLWCQSFFKKIVHSKG